MVRHIKEFFFGRMDFEKGFLEYMSGYLLRSFVGDMSLWSYS